MPVKPLNLDDRTFADLFAEVRSLIPRHAPGWTDHNVSDPGIMVLELFAWLTEAMLYRINRVSDASRVRILELLGATFRPAQPSVLSLLVTVESPLAGSAPYEVKRGRVIWGVTYSGLRVPFEVMRSAKFTPEDPTREVILRQTQLIPSRDASTGAAEDELQPPGKALPRAKSDRPFELLQVGEQFLVLPPEPRPWRPQATVDGAAWTLVTSLQGLRPENTCCFALRPRLNAVAFGAGQREADGRKDETGVIPPAGAKIQVKYRSSPTARAIVTDEFTSTGEPWQLHRLSRPLCRLDLRESPDLEPSLVVQEQPGAWTTWEYVTRFLDMKEGAAQYTFDPWHNALRFGGDRYGRPLSSSALVRLTARFTLGTQGNLPRESSFSGWPPFSAGDKPPKLKVDRWEIRTQGTSPTTLDEARLQMGAMLQPDWRAVTADDFRSVIRSNLPDIARVICLPDHLPSERPSVPTDGENQARPGSVGIMVIPDRTTELTASAQQLSDILATSPDARRLAAVARDAVGHDCGVSLWNMNTHEEAKLPKSEGVQSIDFSTDGRWLVTHLRDTGASSANGTAGLWDAVTGTLVCDLGPMPSPARFSASGRWIVTMHADGARLRDAGDGAVIQALPGQPCWDCLAFGPGDASLLAANGDRAHLWMLTGDREPHDAFEDMPDMAAAYSRGELSCAGPFSAAAYSREGACAAVAMEDGRVRFWQLRPDPRYDRPDLTKTLAVRRKVDIKLDGHGPAHSLLLEPAGTRAVTRGAGGITGLWSTRTGTLLADLSRDAPVSLLAFSADGRWLATAHDGQVTGLPTTVRIWDAISGREFGELAHDTPVVALVFARDCPRVITISSGPARRHTLAAWHLNSGAIDNVATCEIGGDSPPILHTSGRWLAYADERLVHVWDTSRAADISTIYADFDDPAVVLANWRLDPAAALPPTSFGIQAAAALPLALTATRFLRITSAVDSPEVSKRTVALWDAEHAYEAADVLAARRLVTTRDEVVGPTYADVNVHVVVARRLPTIDPLRLKKEIGAALAQFFDPLHGGPDRAGWPLGRSVYMSEICQVVEAVDGVDHVERVSWAPGQAGNPEQSDIPRHSLVKCKTTVDVR